MNHDLEKHRRTDHMELPLFPLNLVYFPGQVLPLHIFEPRYRELIRHCMKTRDPFGIVLQREDEVLEPGDEQRKLIGTAARIIGVEELDDGRMNITTIGTKRFQIHKLHSDKSYLTADVSHYPVLNGRTKRAEELAHRVRPKIVEYVDALSSATKTKLPLNRLPDDPTSLAFLVAMALRIENDDKQDLLSLPGIPDILDKENYLLWREVALLQHMAETQEKVDAMTGGPTGYIFPN